MTSNFKLRNLPIFADIPLLILVAAATIIGIIFAHDAGYAKSIRINSGPLPKEFINQFAFAIIGFGVGSWIAAKNQQHLRKWSRWAFFGSVLALIWVHFFGKELNGAKRWIDLGPIDVQPAEFVKLTAVMFLAATFANRKPLAIPKKFRDWADVLDRKVVPICKRVLPVIWVLAAAYLIESEPDLGTASIVVGICIAMMFVGGVSRRSMVLFSIIGILLVGVLTIKQPYRLDRIVNHASRWTNDFVDDVGYQTTHSETGMAAGGVIGVGIGLGRAKHMLPAATTDFVMATVAEEFGLIGSLGVIGLLGGITYRLFWLAKRNATEFGALVLAGTGAWIGLQTCINAMMANGFLPAIGIPMPFVSSGGSSLLALWLAVGISQSMVAPVKQEGYALSRHGWRNRRPRLSRA